MMRRVAILILTLAIRPSILTAQDAIAPFVIGVWGRGDAIIPFADFDGQRWRSSWPEPVDAAFDPTPLERIPAGWWGRSTFQPTWELVEPDGRRRIIRITGTASARLGSFCSSSLGLKTDASANAFQYGTVLATNRPGVVEPVESLRPGTAEWRTVAALLPDIFQRYETEAWKETTEGFRPDMATPLSRPRLDAASLFRDELGEYAYFQSSREFARRPEQFGELRSFITGWLWGRSPATLFQLVTVQPGTNDPDGKGADVFRPLGVVRHGVRRFWLGFLSSYAYSRLTVLDVRRAGITQLLLVDYPGC